MLAYELARRHYRIERYLEQKPGTQAFPQIAKELQGLSLSHLYDLWNTHADTYALIIPLFLFAQELSPTDVQAQAPDSLKAKFQELNKVFLSTLLQEQERLIQDAQLFRYLYARYLLLEKMVYWESWGAKKGTGIPDRDTFRQYLGAYVQLLQGCKPGSHLLEVWNQTAWLQRWQINDTSRQDLPTQQSLRKQIEKYRLPERGKRLHAALDPGVGHQEDFIHLITTQAPLYLTPFLDPLSFNHDAEQHLREIVQVTMRHTMKKGFRLGGVTSALVNILVHTIASESKDAREWILYTLIQELILGTQNLKYRLNDVLNGVAQSHIPPEKVIWHSIMDGVMEIYESFSLADNALKSFVDQQTKHREVSEHEQYAHLNQRLQTLV